jgi:hypothetical protein
VRSEIARGRAYTMSRPDRSGEREEAVFVALSGWGSGKRKGRRATAKVLVLWGNRPWHGAGLLELRQADPMWLLAEDA